MRHVLFALFDDEETAEGAAAALAADPLLRDACSVVVRDGSDPSSELQVEETSAREGIATGALLGGVLGGIVGGLVFGPFGLVGAGPFVATLFGLLGGSAMGALGGGISGSAQPDPVIEDVRRELQNGKVLLTVQPRSRELVDEVERVCTSFGGRIAHKPSVGFGPLDEEHPRKAA